MRRPRHATTAGTPGSLLLLLAAAAAAAAQQEAVVTTGMGFWAAVKDPGVSTLTLAADVDLADSPFADAHGVPLVLARNLTLRGKAGLFPLLNCR